MSRTKQEGDRKVCHECKANGINIEIHCKKINDSFGERLSWRNPDGSAHFSKEEENGVVTFVHVPTTKTPLEIWQMEIEERLAKVERTTGIMWGE